MRNRTTRGVTFCAMAAAAMTLLAGCVPPGKAVGDTQERDPKVAVDGMDRPDASFGMIGSPNNPAADKLVLDALEASDIHVAYVPVQGVKDQAAAAQDGVRDMVERVVDAIIISDLDVNGGTESGTSADTTESSVDIADGWDDALRLAREAGVPVVLLNPTNPPTDDLLWAAAFRINDRAADATPIDDALMLVADDRPHEREITVTTLVD